MDSSTATNGLRLLLVYRSEWEDREGLSTKRFESSEVDFQSLTVMDHVQKWVAQRDRMGRELLTRKSYTATGRASPFGHMFQAAYIDMWANQGSLELDVNDMVMKSPGRLKSSLVCGDEKRNVKITWKRTQPLSESEAPELDFDIFYYAATPVSSIPVADVVVLYGGECFIFQMTRKTVLTISADGYKRIVERLPKIVKVINFILVCPEGRTVELGDSSRKPCKDFASTEGKTRKFVVAKVPLIPPKSTGADEEDDKIGLDEDKDMTD